MPCNSAKHSHGLTFLEVTTVLVLISILSVVVLIREHGTRTALATATNVLKAHLRYAQSRALNTNTSWGINYDAGQGRYWLFNSVAPGTHRPLPGEEATSIDLTGQDISITGGNILVSFDGWGRPCSNAAGTTPRNANLILTLSDSSGTTMGITITKNTGFIP